MPPLPRARSPRLGDERTQHVPFLAAPRACSPAASSSRPELWHLLPNGSEKLLCAFCEVARTSLPGGSFTSTRQKSLPGFAIQRSLPALPAPKASRPQLLRAFPPAPWRHRGCRPRCPPGWITLAPIRSCTTNSIVPIEQQVGRHHAATSRRIARRAPPRPRDHRAGPRRPEVRPRSASPRRSSLPPPPLGLAPTPAFAPHEAVDCTLKAPAGVSGEGERNCRRTRAPRVIPRKTRRTSWNG